MLAKFKQELLDYIPNMPPWIPDRKVSIATGVSAAGFMAEMVGILNEHFPNLTVNIFPITNFFFGESVTVTGLLTGRDIAVQLDGKDTGSEVFISDVMLRGENGKFLDDLSVSDVENWINKKVTPIENTGAAFVQALLGIKES
jgi:NifB/MoaA-like Fe-S oxidoreductase